MQRTCNGSCAPDKTVVVIEESQETTELLVIGRPREAFNVSDLVRKWAESFSGNLMTKEIDLLFIEFALFLIKDQTMVAKAAEKEAEVMIMLLSVCGEDKDVIQVANDIVRQTLQCRVHKVLECLCCIMQSEGHAQILKEAKRHHHSGNVLRCNWDLIVGTSQVDFAENVGGG